MVPTDNQKNTVSRVTDIKATRIRKNLDRLTELTSTPSTQQRASEYIMVLSNAEKQKAFRERQKLTKKRLDLMIEPEEMEVFTLGAKSLSMTKVKYFSHLLNNQLGVFAAEELEELKEEIKELKKVRTNKEARKEVARLEAEVSELNRIAALNEKTIDRLIEEAKN